MLYISSLDFVSFSVHVSLDPCFHLSFFVHSSKLFCCLYSLSYVYALCYVCLLNSFVTLLFFVCMVFSLMSFSPPAFSSLFVGSIHLCQIYTIQFWIYEYVSWEMYWMLQNKCFKKLCYIFVPLLTHWLGAGVEHVPVWSYFLHHSDDIKGGVGHQCTSTNILWSLKQILIQIFHFSGTL